MQADLDNWTRKRTAAAAASLLLDVAVTLWYDSFRWLGMIMNCYFFSCCWFLDRVGDGWELSVNVFLLMVRWKILLFLLVRLFDDCEHRLQPNGKQGQREGRGCMQQSRAYAHTVSVWTSTCTSIHQRIPCTSTSMDTWAYIYPHPHMLYLPVLRVEDESGNGLQRLCADHVAAVVERRQQHLRLRVHVYILLCAYVCVHMYVCILYAYVYYMHMYVYVCIYI